MFQWGHNWGTKIDRMEADIARGIRVPDEYNARPDILPESRFYYHAINDLGTERSFGMGMGPIPRSCVMAYAIEHGITDDDGLDDFWSLIRKLDQEVMRISMPKSDHDKVAERQSSKKKTMPKPVNAARARAVK